MHFLWIIINLLNVFGVYLKIHHLVIKKQFRRSTVTITNAQPNAYQCVAYIPVNTAKPKQE